MLHGRGNGSSRGKKAARKEEGLGGVSAEGQYVKDP